MDALVREIKATIDAYKRKGQLISQERRAQIVFNVAAYRSIGRIIPGIKSDEEVWELNTENVETVHVPDPFFSQPPVNLENYQNLTGISQQYRLPVGLTEEEVQNYALVLWHALERQDMSEEEAVKKYQRLQGVLIELNPELSKLKSKGVYGRLNMLWGVASRFNVNDLDFYLSGNTFGLVRANPKYMALYKNIEDICGSIRFVASPETMQNIQQQLDATKGKVMRKSWDPPIVIEG